MRLDSLNSTVLELCVAISEAKNDFAGWSELTETKLLFEAALCISGSQTVWEVAVATAERLRDSGLLVPTSPSSEQRYESAVLDALAAPLTLVDSRGRTRMVRARFPGRIAANLSKTVQRLYRESNPLGSILGAAGSPSEARSMMIQAVCGFGPKQASLFLRRVGFSSDLAIVDTHILGYLDLVDHAPSRRGHLGRLAFYESVEEEFRSVAYSFGYSLACVDLATWITMRVARRERMI